MLVIHVGLHKTGTTSLQNLLPKICRFKKDFIYKKESYSYLTDLEKHNKWSQNIVKTSKKSTLILSSEASLGSMGKMYEEAPSRISLLSDKFIKNCDTKIIITLREPLAWIESIYSQQIHQGLTPNSDDFIKKASSARYFHYKNLLDLIFNFIDKKNVIIIPYSDIVVKDILKEIGFSINFVNSYKLKNKDNISVKSYKLELFRRMNKISNKFESTFLRDYFQSQASSKLKKSIFSREDQEFLINEFKDDWSYVIDEYGSNAGKKVESKIEFKESIYDDNSIEEKLLQEAINLLKMNIMKLDDSYENKIKRIKTKIRKIISK